ncbi:hypothetical protein [Tenacibaculum maritimum]|uniref:hypothetical protein n=1 Tax=Tenacibaculum maritimum TaxID=107401 RepID=UPI0012E54177|nr:hypothetical protein [Tenacibaculum maritimum]CAA0140976.1 conserved hypothetical protein [Tenacibaculum maritimum]CAA0165374.1 conserved hypothetical protein [Tenacibaculum maritimum]CAA0247462.1 conserved hypothetical protein [Tenacibaculum maritimum]CAA0248864.1 conserved hypothetical protein [Tenacibaculum maritimum]CAA0251270.1 conserved hypothetical protein [Tenacibaculum maritimum]
MKKILFTILLLFIISCEAIFVENISSKSITLIAPSDASKLPSGIINFNWNSLEDSQDYHLQIASPNFSNATQIVLDTITISTSFNKELSAGKYEWRIKAKNLEYETGYTTNSFTVN